MAKAYGDIENFPNWNLFHAYYPHENEVGSGSGIGIEKTNEESRTYSKNFYFLTCRSTGSSLNANANKLHVAGLLEAVDRSKHRVGVCHVI